MKHQHSLWQTFVLQLFRLSVQKGLVFPTLTHNGPVSFVSAGDVIIALTYDHVAKIALIIALTYDHVAIIALVRNQRIVRD